LPLPDCGGSAARDCGARGARFADRCGFGGYDLSALRARVIAPEDFASFDLILAMDRENLSALRQRAPHKFQDRIRLFLEFAPGLGTSEVPDPYYGGPNGFEEVLDLVEDATRALIAYLRDTQVRQSGAR